MLSTSTGGQMRHMAAGDVDDAFEEEEFVALGSDEDFTENDSDDDIERTEQTRWQRFRAWTCMGACAQRFPFVEKIRKPVWAFVDDPASSKGAYVWSLFILILIVISVGTFLIETMPRFQPDPPIAFFWIETVVVAVFTVEFVTRIISAPDKLEFCLGVLNWVDFLAIAPYYIELFISGAPGLAWIRVIRLTRVFRVFKVGRFQYGFLLFYFTFKQSIETLFMGLVFICLGMILFASFIFYAEQTQADFDRVIQRWVYSDDSLSPGDESPFQSIPHSFWWCIVTMTTVGYGDNFPITPLGKAVAGVTFLAGLLVRRLVFLPLMVDSLSVAMIIAFPIAILGNKFLDLYLEQEERNRVESRKKKEARFAVHPGEQFAHLSAPLEPVAQELAACSKLMRELHVLMQALDAHQAEVDRALGLFDINKNAKTLLDVEYE